MKYTPKRHISVKGYGNGRFNKSTTLLEALNTLGVKLEPPLKVTLGECELNPSMTLEQLELYDAMLEVK